MRPDTILIVDDEVDLLDEMTLMLTDSGYNCLTASSAKDALDLLENKATISVLVSDVRMPDMDGLAMLSAIRSRFFDRPWLQVVFITGYASLEGAVTALRLEAADFLQKPIEEKRLVEAMARAVRRAQTKRHMLTPWKELDHHLGRIEHEAQRIADLLSEATPPSGEAAIPKLQLAEDDQLPHDRLMQMIAAQRRTRAFSDKIFAEPVWDMLWELLHCKLIQRPLSVSSICIVAGIPMRTALRRLNELIDAGLVIRSPDLSDGRRHFVSLSDDTAEKLIAYLHDIHRKLQLS